MSFAQDVTYEIIEFGSTEPLAVVGGHDLSSFSLHRHQARFHEQVESATFILQLQRSVVFVADHAGKFSTISCNGSCGIGSPSGRLHNRFSNLADLMIPCETRELIGHGLSSEVTGTATRFSEEHITTAIWVSSHRASS
ncbi:MAG TPA: hypothetical protein VE866_01615 [Candidatus Binatia bacterium]|nr:hypothetical protein [Candidatus Binatia bacterium]